VSAAPGMVVGTEDTSGHANTPLDHAPGLDESTVNGKSASPVMQPPM